MADVRSYLKEKRERDDITYKEKIHKHKLFTLYRVLLVVVAVLVIVVLVAIQYKNRVYDGYEVIDTYEKEEIKGIVEVPLSNTVLTYSKDGAHCTDAKGNVLWNQTYEMQSPMLSVCEDVVALADYNGGTIYIYNTAGKMGTVNTTMPIRHMTVAANGVVAAVLDEGDTTWVVVFNTEGDKLVDFKKTMKNSGYPISVSLSSNGLLCAISYMYVDMGEIKSSIAFYNFGEVGKNQADNLVCGYEFVDCIIPCVQFIGTRNAFAVGDDRVVFFAGIQKPENIATVLVSEEIRAVYYNKEYVGLVFANERGSGYRLDVYNTSGEKVISKEFDMEYINILFDNKNFLIYNETEVYLGTMDGIEKYRGNFDKAITTIIPTGTSYRYTLVTKDSIDTIRMR